VTLFHNAGGSNHGLRIKLIGNKSNRDGIGAIVRLKNGADSQYQMLHSGGYLSQSELVLTFGLGATTKADSIQIDWPSGQVDRLSNINADETISVEEGRGVVSARPFKK